MARDHARLYVSILSDDDWRARGPMAQWLYGVLLAQPDLTYAGVTDVRLGRWAASSAGVTVAMVEDALAELEQHRFVVVDRTTEEVLVRSYLRRNEIWKQPKLLTLALRQVAAIQSPKLRAAMRYELLRLPADSRTAPAIAMTGTLPDSPWHTPGDTPRGTPPDRPGDTPDPTQRDTPARTHAPGVRAHAGASQPGTSNQEPGTSLPLENSSGGNETLVDAREGTNTPHSNSIPTNNNTNSTRPRCLAHRHLPDDDPGPNCVGCREARRRDDDATMQAALERQRATRDCRECDADGWRLDRYRRPVHPPQRCDHVPSDDEPSEPAGPAGDVSEFDRIRADSVRAPCPICHATTDEPCRGTRAPAHAARIAAARKVPA